MKQTYTTQQAAKILKCSVRTIRNMIHRGSLYATKIDPTTKSVYTIDADEVKLLMEKARRSPQKNNRI